MSEDKGNIWDGVTPTLTTPVLRYRAFLKDGSNGPRWWGRYRLDDGPTVELPLEVDTKELAENKIEAFARSAAEERVRSISPDAEASDSEVTRSYTLHRHLSGTWGVRFKKANGDKVELSTGEKVLASARKVAERMHRARLVMPEELKPVWWSDQHAQRVPAFEVRRLRETMEIRPLVEIRRSPDATSFFTHAHRVTPRDEPDSSPTVVEFDAPTDGQVIDGVATPHDGEVYHFETQLDDRIGHAADSFEPKGNVDTNIIRQGGGWSTFKRDGDWWAQREQIPLRTTLGSTNHIRVEFSLCTSSEEESGTRFYQLQNEFRETHIDDLLKATYALRAGWERAKRVGAFSIGRSAPAGPDDLYMSRRIPMPVTPEDDAFPVGCGGQPQPALPPDPEGPKSSESSAENYARGPIEVRAMVSDTEEASYKDYKRQQVMMTKDGSRYVVAGSSEANAAAAEGLLNVKPESAGTWLGVPLKDCEQVGSLELRQLGGLGWAVYLLNSEMLNKLRVGHDCDLASRCVASGDSGEIDELTRLWIARVGALQPKRSVKSWREVEGGIEVTFDDGAVVKSPDGIRWKP